MTQNAETQSEVLPTHSLENEALFNMLSKKAALLRTAPAESTWALWQFMARRLFRLQSRFKKENVAFSKNGFHVGQLPKDLADRCLDLVKNAPAIKFEPQDFLPGYIFNPKTVKISHEMNDAVTYLQIDETTRALFEELIAEVEPIASSCLGMRFRVANVRMFRVDKPMETVGPGAWHLDGMPHALHKILLYPAGVGPEIGTTDIQTTDGEVVSLDGPQGTWCLFKNSDLLHRGRCLGGGQRYTIEFTLVPSLGPDRPIVVAGLNSAYPIAPWNTTTEKHWLHETVELPALRVLQLLKKGYRSVFNVLDIRKHRGIRARIILLLNKFLKPHSINIGGGKSFLHMRWVNLDSNVSSHNRTPFYLTESCTFPIADSSLSHAWSSHSLEHLDDETVDRVMTETFRVLKPGGRFTICLPDFHGLMEAWRQNDLEAIASASSGYNRYVYCWKNRAVPDDPDHRLASIFCGYWNEAFGDPYRMAGSLPSGEDIYFGPPKLPADKIPAYKDLTPHAFAKELRSLIHEPDMEIFYNHQNAWNKDELKALLEKHGFKVLSMDKSAIAQDMKNIPNLRKHYDDSMYCIAKKP